MADESSKTKKVWGELEHAVLRGEGIDIGCGADPVFPHVMPFDLAQGDANEILQHVHRQFDFVYASHCLEHMRDPRAAIAQWWALVKPGGVLFVIVPDEDLYEQGFWPSRFNRDHKWTFTIAGRASWSPVSVNLRELADCLPGGKVLDIRLFDTAYDRRLQSNGRMAGTIRWKLERAAGRVAYGVLRLLGGDKEALKRRFIRPIDQTAFPDTLAQIQCIVRKAGALDA
ncbi:MAG: methyltransferase domain-containing protein [Betaproteobacteria bacterium]|nr:methyltransferase domain-containing protein [Betaproteobacteria bacterium]